MNKGKFVPVMLTPFKEDMKLDYRGIAALIDFYLAAGVKGFFANCQSSEMFSITTDEKLLLTHYVSNYINGEFPVVATGSFGVTVEQKAEFAKKIFDTGVEAVILLTCHFAGVNESDDILIENLMKMFSLTGQIPMGTYECPAPYKRILGERVFGELLKTNRLVYHKDTSINHDIVKTKLDVLKSNPGRMEFFDAHTPNAIFSMKNGAAGMSSISGNFYPEIMIWMIENFNNPEKQEDVRWIQGELSDVDPLIHVGYPVSAKYFLRKRGLPISTKSRVFTMQLTVDQKNILDGIYLKFLGWCERLNIEPVTMKILS